MPLCYSKKHNEEKKRFQKLCSSLFLHLLLLLFNSLHPFTPQSSLFSILSRQSGVIFFTLLFQKKKKKELLSASRGAYLFSAKLAAAARRRRTGPHRGARMSRARSGLAARCHNKTHKLPIASGAFGFFVLPCSQCRSGR